MGTPYAGFWNRFAAALLDGIILYILGAVIGFVIGLIVGAFVTPDTARAIGFVVGIVISWLYYAIQESSAQQATIGKRALNIRVTDINGDRISFAKATIRYFSKFLSGLILLIGYIMAAFTEKKQALHDIIAGTLVVKNR